MSKEFIIFENDELSFKDKFHRLMDLLISNKSTTRMEQIILFGIFYIQLLSGFFDNNIGVIDINKSKSDEFLNYLNKIVRVKGLIVSNYQIFTTTIYFLFGISIFLTGFFLNLIQRINKSTFYSYLERIMNSIIKGFIFISFNPILDLTLSNLCFETLNPIFDGVTVTCGMTDNTTVYVLSIILFIYVIFVGFGLNIFYNESYFLSNSYYSRMNCAYEFYLTINSIIYSVLLSQVKYISKELFIIYNLISSILFLQFYFNKFLFYDVKTNFIVGFFHVLYVWTSIFFIIFNYIDIGEKSLIYIIGSIFMLPLFYNIKYRLEENILFKSPYHKITNKYHFMFYIKSIMDKIHSTESNVESRAELIGIINTHINECPQSDCMVKNKDNRIYLPVLEEWTNRDKPEINDKIFLLNFIIALMKYFINQNYFSPDMLINISLYYLQIIGNYCQAIYYYNLVKDMKITLQENFSLVRLNFAISKSLIDKLRPSTESCVNLEELNTTLYFKYEDLSLKFFEEINKDINLSLEFWNTFKGYHQRKNILDYNKIFNLTDKIRITKGKIEKFWYELMSTFVGVNDLLDLYETYVEQINDDDMLKRDLETIRSKNLISNDHIQVNYYNVLFNKDTGIIICNGNKSKEGIVEKINKEIEKIFKYKSDELVGMNISYLMPKMFQIYHKMFMENFFENGEKKRIDRIFKSFAKDKEKYLLSLRLLIKLYPVLNENVYYCSMVIRENLDDIILIDSKFNIQGISKKLMAKFEIDNIHLFDECDIPFYIICKKFINFYKTFLCTENRKTKKDKLKKSQNSMNLQNSPNETTEFNSEREIINKIDSQKTIAGPSKLQKGVDENNVDIHENIEIKENIELEYEISVPWFLKCYVSANTSTKNVSKYNKENFNKRGKNDVTSDEFAEEDNLVLFENENKNDDDNEILDKSANRQSNEEKEIKLKIKQFRELFETGKFNELLENISKLNKDTETKEFKFNFTFDQYKYGSRNVAYIIRCIDNKTEYDSSGSCSLVGDNQTEKENHSRQLKAKLDALKNLNDVTTSEKMQIEENSTEYLKLCIEDKEFLKIQSTFKDEIAIGSKVFGIKKEEAQVDDENSSQSSSAGFNDNIAKKSRIEEIRSNIMLNVSNFYLLKWIKSVFILMIISTALFCGFYLMIFDIILVDLNDTSNLNKGLFQSTIWMCNTISTLISLRSIYQLKNNNSSIKFNSYIENQSNYFNTLQDFSLNWYNKIMVSLGPIEQEINIYFQNETQDIFWQSRPIKYPFVSSSVKDTESFPMVFIQVLNSINQLMKNKFFTINSNGSYLIDNHSNDYLDYLGFISIENSIENLVPRQLEILGLVPTIFKDQNDGNMQFVIIVMMSYISSILILVIIYAFLLYLTNKNMQEGIEKISKIKLDKIEETIKKIELFNEKCLSKHRMKDSKINGKNKNFKINGNIIGNNSMINNMKSDSLINDGGNYKNLQILSYSYLQILEIIIIMAALLTPIYFVSQGMVNSSNQILSVQNYIFGKSLIASASTVNIKCMMSLCNTQKNLNYSMLLTQYTEIENIVRNIGNFPELSDFYNNKFLLDACAVTFATNTSMYQNCMNDIYIKSANNTDSLLKLIDETILTITKDREMKMNIPYQLDDKSIPFSNKFLFETNYFKDLEYIFYNYITPLSDSFSDVVSLSLNNYVLEEKTKIIIMICIFGVSVLVFSFYIAFFFTKNLIKMLSVSRCILRIIPTSVINSTQELETWIENKY